MDTLDFGVSHRRPLRVSSKPQERFPTWSLYSSQIELILFRSTTERLYFISASMLCYGIYADTLVSKTLLKEFDNNELISLSEAFLKITILRIPQNSKKKKIVTGSVFDKATNFRSPTLPTPSKVLSCEFGEIFQNRFFKYIPVQLLLKFIILFQFFMLSKFM